MRTLIEMAHEVYGEHVFWTEDQLLKLKAFADLVRADEREACARVCYELPWKDGGHIPSNLAFAAAIRARAKP